MVLPPSKNKTSRGFTLVELLIAMSLMLILAAISVPTLRTFSNAEGLNASAGLVSNLLTLARTQAITLRAPVQLRIVTTGSSDPSISYRKMTLWTLTRDDAGDVQWDASHNPIWTQLTAWQTLDPRAVLETAADPTSTTPSYNFTASNRPGSNYVHLFNSAYTMQALTTPSPILANQTVGAQTVSEIALEFLPTGALNSSSNVYLLLTSGSYDGTRLKYTQKSLSNWVQIRIAYLTGTLSLVRP